MLRLPGEVVSGDYPRLTIAQDGFIYGTVSFETSASGYDDGMLFAINPPGAAPTFLSSAVSVGSITVSFTTKAGSTNRVQRAPTLDGPWNTFLEQVAPDTGFIKFSDLRGQSKAFYRAFRVGP
jgi:hypothetical protein